MKNRLEREKLTENWVWWSVVRSPVRGQAQVVPRASTRSILFIPFVKHLSDGAVQLQHVSDGTGWAEGVGCAGTPVKFSTEVPGSAPREGGREGPALQ